MPIFILFGMYKYGTGIYLICFLKLISHRYSYSPDHIIASYFSFRLLAHFISKEQMFMLILICIVCINKKCLFIHIKYI